MDLTNEKWITIRDFPNYEISNYGRVRRQEREDADSWGRDRYYDRQFIKPHNGNVILWRDGLSSCRSVKKLQKIAFGE